MHICIDSCVFIQGIESLDHAAELLFSLISKDLRLSIPRLVAKEVVRNLHSAEKQRRFYKIFTHGQIAQVVDAPVPQPLVDKYVQMGLPGKADAFIGAFAEWQRVNYLISNNRHFLRVLHPDAFTVLDAATFIAHWDTRNF